MCCIFLRSFYGEDCCQYHRTGPNPSLKSICKTFKKCPEFLRKVVKSNRGDWRSLLAKYRWGVAKCQVCKEYVNIRCHKCCFQLAEKERRRARWNRTGRGRFSFIARPMKMRTQECFKNCWRVTSWKRHRRLSLSSFLRFHRSVPIPFQNEFDLTPEKHPEQSLESRWAWWPL